MFSYKFQLINSTRYHFLLYFIIYIMFEVWLTVIKNSVYNSEFSGSFNLCTQVSSTNTTDRHDITEILLIVALSTMNTNLKPTSRSLYFYFLLFDYFQTLFVVLCSSKNTQSVICTFFFNWKRHETLINNERVQD